MKSIEKNLGLFFTRDLSLSKWDKAGILDREIKPYIKLAEKFDKIYFFTYGGEFDHSYSKILPANIKIVTKPKYLPSFIYSFILPFMHKKCLKSCQILKTNQMDGSWVAVIAKKLYGGKLVIRCGYEWLYYLESTRSSILKRFIAYWIEKFSYKNADKIIITSDDAKHFIMRVFKVSENKIEVISNYIDTNQFTPIGVPKENKVIFVGRLEPVKNLMNLVDAMTGIDATLTLIGEGSLRADLEKRATLKGVKVEFKGKVSQANLPEELNRSQVFILPSLSEGNPKALLEAMSCGLACVGANVKGINNIIKDQENGLLCGTDSKSIHDTLSLLLSNDQIIKQIGDSARRSIEENFSLDKVLGKESNLYDQILRQEK